MRLLRATREFPDFGFYVMDVECAHLIRGFGRIVEFPDAELVERRDLDLLVRGEPQLLEACADLDVTARARLAQDGRVSSQSDEWQISGIDHEGLDLIGPNGTRRVVFPGPVSDSRTRHGLPFAVSQASIEEMN